MNRIQIGGTILATAATLAAVLFYLKFDAWVAIPSARTPMTRLLKDPASAQFRDERLTRAGVLCGEVNAKNSMGGYIGFRKYISVNEQSVYIEHDGVLGEWKTADIIAQLERKNELLRQYIQWRKEGVDVPEYSDREMDEKANKRLFESRWKELCEGVMA
ncbi:hypothetical protein [Massilia aerilata]|uniref:Uncharacterized protein n=1 Tax=Massilia aerilata TaxID=453817 RepID=A0ABW0RXC2_9BURK